MIIEILVMALIIIILFIILAIIRVEVCDDDIM